MVRYFFDLQEQPLVRDDEGTELPDIAVAQMEAAETLADMARDLSFKRF
jgi:hypothetical protein